MCEVGGLAEKKNRLINCCVYELELDYKEQQKYACCLNEIFLQQYSTKFENKRWFWKIFTQVKKTTLIILIADKI